MRKHSLHVCDLIRHETDLQTESHLPEQFDHIKFPSAKLQRDNWHFEGDGISVMFGRPKYSYSQILKVITNRAKRRIWHKYRKYFGYKSVVFVAVKRHNRYAAEPQT